MLTNEDKAQILNNVNILKKMFIKCNIDVELVDKLINVLVKENDCYQICLCIINLLYEIKMQEDFINNYNKNDNIVIFYVIADYRMTFKMWINILIDYEIIKYNRYIKYYSNNNYESEIKYVRNIFYLIDQVILDKNNFCKLSEEINIKYPLTCLTANKIQKEILGVCNSSVTDITKKFLLEKIKIKYINQFKLFF